MSYSNIKGQDQAIKFLQTAMRNGKLSHAYIFAGPSGCGQSLLARNFAKALNCGANIDSAPCDNCISCNKIDKDIHPDIKWIKKDERSRQIKIEEIRGLESQIILKPYEGKYKVFILVEAELMNIEAANSFLKTLEEPPQNSILILIVERPKDLLPTIASRCQVIRLRPLEADTLKTILVNDHGISEKKAEFLSRVSEGRLDRAISYDRDILEWKNSALEELSDDECAEDYTAADRDELSKKLNILVSWYRDLLVFKATQNEGLLINIDRVDDIKEEAIFYDMDRLMRIFEGAVSAKENIESNVNPKLALSALFKVAGRGH
jgi:DNA polymerase-3 subunit delta'